MYESQDPSFLTLVHDGIPKSWQRRRRQLLQRPRFAESVQQEDRQGNKHRAHKHSDKIRLIFFPQDLEDQPGPAAAERVKGSDSESKGRQASTSGRGGAGNVTTRDVLAAGTTANVDVTPSLQENRPPDLGHYGRGGAGNYRSPELEKGKSGEKGDLEAQQQRAHEKVVRDVEMGLKEPEKVYLGR